MKAYFFSMGVVKCYMSAIPSNVVRMCLEVYMWLLDFFVAEMEALKFVVGGKSTYLYKSPFSSS